MNDARPLTIAELEERSGVAARTIRFYIARGLLDGPDKPGRAAAYSPAHLERLAMIRRLQRRGLTLSEIARSLAGEGRGTVPQPSPWWQYPVSADVLVWVRADAAPWRLRKIREALNDLAARLGQSNSGEGERRSHEGGRNG